MKISAATQRQIARTSTIGLTEMISELEGHNPMTDYEQAMTDAAYDELDMRNEQTEANTGGMNGIPPQF